MSLTVFEKLAATAAVDAAMVPKVSVTPDHALDGLLDSEKTAREAPRERESEAVRVFVSLISGKAARRETRATRPEATVPAISHGFLFKRVPPVCGFVNFIVRIAWKIATAPRC